MGASRLAPWSLAIVLGALAGSTGLADQSAAEASYLTDDQGRVVLEIRDDGTRIAYSYSPDGRVIKTKLADGSQIEVQPAGGEARDEP